MKTKIFWKQKFDWQIGFDWHAHLKLHDQFIALIYMKLHTQNQLYTPISFWDIKVLKAFLGMPRHAWPQPPKLTLSIYKYEAICTKLTLYLCSFWDLKVLIAFLGIWACLTTTTSHHQFVALIDMYLQAKNQLYTSYSFWDTKV